MTVIDHGLTERAAQIQSTLRIRGIVKRRRQATFRDGFGNLHRFACLVVERGEVDGSMWSANDVARCISVHESVTAHDVC